MISPSLRSAPAFASLALLASLSFVQCKSKPTSVGGGTQYLYQDAFTTNPSRPRDPGDNTPNLVNIREAIPSIEIELRYAGSQNVLGKPLYPKDMPCLLHPAVVEKLRKAQSYLNAKGYSLKIWDAWRPPAAQRRLFDEAPPEGKDYIADPDNFWSQHCNGTAVDVTLVNLRGQEMKMPTDFDSFSKDAAFHYRGGNPAIRKHVFILQRAMYRAGFYGLELEWWHFNDVANHRAEVVFAADVGVTLPKN
ncbi:MAG: M15 family metallopeptidase [Verrucomicrobiota bacterium]